jgi:hypothetical protein
VRASDEREVHPEKQYEPISLSDSGKMMDGSEVHPEKQ